MQDDIVTNVNVRDVGGQRLDVKVEILRFASVDEFEQVARARVMDALPFPHTCHAIEYSASTTRLLESRGVHRSAQVRHVFGSHTALVASRGMVEM